MSDALKQEVEVLIKLPRNYQQQSATFQRSTTIFPIRLYDHANVYVTNSGICFKMWFQLLPGSFTFVSSIKREQQKIAFASFFLKKRKMLDPQKAYAVIHNQWYSGYYHWLMECLPRLIRLIEERQDVIVLLPAKAKSIHFIQDSLALFQEIKFEYVDKNELAFVKRLVLPEHLPSEGLFDTRFIKALRKRLSINEQVKKSFRRLYISRKKATRRKIVNEEDVLRLLTVYGFEEVVLEDLSFFEQVVLFQEANFTISIHGAGLTNMVFMNSASVVLEIFKRPKVSENYTTCYQILASAFDVSYYCLLADPENEEEIFDSVNLLVDLSELDLIVKQALNSN